MGNKYNSNINDVYIIQKKIIRIIFNKPKLKNTVSPNSSLFNKKIIPYNIRKKHELYTHFTSKNKCLYTLYIKGSTIWNELNDELKEIKPLNKFKNKLKNYLILN